MKKVLITGGLGYLGVVLANYLEANPQALTWGGAQDPFEVTLLDVRGDTANKGLLSRPYPTLISDLSGKEAPRLAAERYDSIFHMGSAVSAACQRDPDLALKNVEATLTILEAASASGKRPTVVFPSSILVFEGMAVATDDTAPNAARPYGNSKWQSEDLGTRYTESVDFRGLRLPTVIAAREPTSAATAYAYNAPNKLLRGQDVSIPVPKGHRMPLIWIDDVIEALVQIHNVNENALSSQSTPYRVMNLTGYSPTAEDWISAIENEGRSHGIGLGKVRWETDEFTMSVLGEGIQEIQGAAAARLGIYPTTSPAEMARKVRESL